MLQKHKYIVIYFLLFVSISFITVCCMYICYCASCLFWHCYTMTHLKLQIGEKDIRNRICKARTAFMKLKKIWASNTYSLQTKVRLFNALVKSVLLYGCEAWRVNEVDNRRMDTFMFKCYRRIMKIRWPYVISNDNILNRIKQRRISEEQKVEMVRTCAKNGRHK